MALGPENLRIGKHALIPLGAGDVHLDHLPCREKRGGHGGLQGG
jgi:hypothetical protein